MIVHWNGILPIRRYAIFNDLLYGNYTTVVCGEFDLAHAEKWGGFVRWLGGIHPAEQKTIKKPNAAHEGRRESEVGRE